MQTLPIDPATAIKREMLYLMGHQLTAWYSSVFLLGKTILTDKIPTACTDGYNVEINPAFMAPLTRPQIRSLILHENFHKAYLHIPHLREWWKKNPILTNIAADYVVNANIVLLMQKDKTLVEPLPGWLYDPKFHGWSVPEVYRFLEKAMPPMGGCEGKVKMSGNKITINGKTYGGDTLDEHIFDKPPGQGEGESDGNGKGEVPDDHTLGQQISDALLQGGMLAGKLGVPLPRDVTQVLEPKVDWRPYYQDFATSSVRGHEAATWRRYNRRRMADGYCLPGTHKETMTLLVNAIDMSGSISEQQCNEFIAEIVSSSCAANPDKLMILWWTTQVESVQVFEQGEYETMRERIKPNGSGGTHVGCVSDYLVKNNIKPDAIAVFTDGHVESDIDWQVSAPTLWLVTENTRFVPPAGGQMVRVHTEN